MTLTENHSCYISIIIIQTVNDGRSKSNFVAFVSE